MIELGQIVDLDQIVGATGVSSGIAIKMKFQPIFLATNNFIKYFNVGLRKRIRLINSIKEILGEETIDDRFIDIVYTRNLSVEDEVVEKLMKPVNFDNTNSQDNSNEKDVSSNETNMTEQNIADIENNS